MKDKFLTNYSNETFLDHIKGCLSKCKQFSFSVSFIKIAGLNLLKADIEEALKENKKGRIICSAYQNFTDILTLKTFKKWADTYPNFECRFDLDCFNDNGFHSKGYLFAYDDSYEIVVGSSNITTFALLKNIEWNISLLNEDEFESYNDAEKQYDELWYKTLNLTDEVIEQYRVKQEYAVDKWDMDFFNFDKNDIRPNKMQERALKELRRNRNLGVQRSLVVAATGSGKTYLAAFDAFNFDAKRLLFICHRDVILTEALKTFRSVFATSRTYGLYGNNNKEIDADFVFASTQTLVKHLDEFNKDEFDYIVYDEVHHIMADSGTKIFEYFKPQFLLGLTATPNRTDNKDVIGLFDNNVPFDLSIRDAIINDLVVPFHYYGIRDELISYDDKKSSEEIIKSISSNLNIDFICKEIEMHKKPGEKLKAIVFCVNKYHCREMRDLFIERDYSACSLSAEDNTGERIKAFNDLQNEDNPLQIICAVDILNEGIDIPAINMVVFLRPTESQIVFLQQLGRGLRKYHNKEYLTVLDFIANDYRRSMNIAMALGSLSSTPYKEKTFLMDTIKNDFKNLDVEGVEIHIDELSKKEILEALKNTNLNRCNYLKTDYNNFKKYLHLQAYPKHVDYLNKEIAPDLLRLIKAKINNKKCKSYYKFLKNIGEKDLPIFTDEQIEVIDNISELLPLVRKDEFELIKQLLNEGKIDITKLISGKVNEKTLNNALAYLLKDNIIVDGHFIKGIVNDEFKEYVLDLVEYGLKRYDDEFGDYQGLFKPYANYFKYQIKRIRLNKTDNFIKGTEYDDDTKEAFVTVILEKGKVKDQLNYKDRFISDKVFQWESINGATLNVNFHQF